jgi:trimeric autotransporter adhesin
MKIVQKKGRERGLGPGRLLVIACVCGSFLISLLSAAERHGQVKFGGLPVPGATVTASQGDKKLSAVTDPDGNYSFPDLPDGPWTLEVQMQGFEPSKQDVNVGGDAALPDAELKILPLDQIHAQIQESTAPAPAPRVDVATNPATPAQPTVKGKQQTQPTNTQTAFQRTDVNATAAPAPAADQPAPVSEAFANQSAADLNQRASDGFLVNGTTNNGASSPFALNQAFGNNRRGGRSLYNGNLAFTINNSTLDARTFSLTGQDTPKPYTNQLTFAGSFGGPIKIPHFIPRNGPQFTVNYQLSRNRSGVSTPSLMPTQAEQGGNFSQVLTSQGTPVQIFNPLINGCNLLAPGAPFPNNTIPAQCISPQAAALAQYFPTPNTTGRYNYQIPLVTDTHTDALQSRVQKQIGRKNNIFGQFAFQSIRTAAPNLFNFLDTTDTFGLNAGVNWRHNFTPRLFSTFGYQYSRQSVNLLPFFQNKTNVEGLAGITGADESPVNWGPPSLGFTSGIQTLNDASPNLTRNQTNWLSDNNSWIHGRHQLDFGADYRRQEFNYNSQQNPRGTFTFTGAATESIVNGAPVIGTGSDFADFLLGIPDTSAIAFGNADKYLRANSDDAFVRDVWRLSPGLTMDIGVRWEYWSPVSELYGRLVNLDVAPGFTAVDPVVGYDPVGPLTKITYPSSLIRPDKHEFQPRIGLAWRPISGSSVIVRAGYGVGYNTSPYQFIANQMAQQSPLSKSLSVQNSSTDPLTLASGFNAAPNITTNTFAVDPNFRIGYVQNWSLAIQRDLPAGLQMVASYLGTKGTRGMQEFLPNTYPEGAINPCPTCPSGFYYLTSNGNSTREAGSFQLRRRLRSGFTATAQYTFSKALDDSALGGQGSGGTVIAQNWLDLSAERGLSPFNQKHLLTLQAQYTSGLGLHGGSLLSGWRGALLKEWTLLSNITVGSGLPLTPSYPAFAINGTGVTGPVRPDYTGAPLYAAPAGLFLNPAAYTAPLPGQWGNAGRDTIIGPSQFSLNASLARNFRVSDRLSLDLSVNSTNALNHVVFSAWNVNVTNAQFGLPTGANGMRTISTTLRLRF